jgi:hypothetical protein
MGVAEGRGRASIEIHGLLSLIVKGPDGQIRDRRDGENVVCTQGFSQIAAALMWSGMQDQAANLGTTTPTFLTPLYGAVGSGAGVPAKSDTALFTELGRQPVGGAGASPASSLVASQATWLFYFPQQGGTWTVTEAGVFAGATSVAGSGFMMDHWAFSPSVTVPTTDTLILQLSLAFGP